ncbi:probable caffeoyl-CoA O-methyltransferase 2 [Procambarus clarkii]|uniref:probable caffeoyl-CoA O-methyltransferase 2 n=1 Tax=Procambarus clarkii TaxID=6728 RepID=UPI001E670469|nr:probable caffeoyl-CoA O-methyltransferase 2 [Procambarus clarkii]
MDPRVSVLKSFHSAKPLVKYVVDHSLRQTDVQKKLLEETLKLPHGGMVGAPEVLQLGANLIQAIGAKKVLDVGMFTGASALSAALVLPPDGEVHCLDISDEYTSLAEKYWEEGGVRAKIHTHIAPAADSLQKFIDAGQAGSFDYAFIDADKVNIDLYYEKCLVLVRPGGIITIDNTLQGGCVLDETQQSPSVLAVRSLNLKLKDDERINISFLNIGDGFTLCFKK